VRTTFDLAQRIGSAIGQVRPIVLVSRMER
jgi:hypothetical protein